MYYHLRIQEAGGEAIDLHPGSVDRVDDAINRLDGLLLSGGADINPCLFNEEPGSNTSKPDDMRDALELKLIKSASDRKIPILAICRGAQILNVSQGGALIQHVGDGVHPADGAVSRFHDVKIDSQSTLGSVLNVEQMKVNSRHHQAIDPTRVAPSLRVVAQSKDGIVEAVEGPASTWTIGIQWHPERDEIKDNFLGLFKEFVQQASARRLEKKCEGDGKRSTYARDAEVWCQWAEHTYSGAKVLFESDNPFLWFSAAVLGHHALEMFLKAALIKKGHSINRTDTWGHNLVQLSTLLAAKDAQYPTQVHEKLRTFDEFFDELRYPTKLKEVEGLGQEHGAILDTLVQQIRPLARENTTGTEGPRA
ncbi:MAG: glutamine amidotransferase [Acidobacteriales bacterium]|nr:glutamine amidotransferase [Terriglobales bacterium]